MQVAALYDIHGNLPALEAVLQDIRGLEVDQVVVGGDVVAGPLPRETLDCLLALDLPVHYVQGNADAEILAQLAGEETGRVPPELQESIRWVTEQLRPEHEAVLAGWPETVRLTITGSGEVLFCHATPRNNTDVFTRLTPEERLLPIFEAANVPLVVCGHTHMQFDRMIGTTRVVNAGSVGMPYAEPGAYWLLLGPEVQFRHTAYDLEKAAGRVRATSYPQADQFAARNVLQPPSESEALEVFTRMQLT